MHLTLKQLQYFVATLKAGSIARAAESQHVTATALGLQLKELEDQFGVLLLQRHSRGVEPTPLGVELYGRAVRILDLANDAARLLSERAPVRQVRLGAPPSIARLIGVEAMLAASECLDGGALVVSEGWTIDLEQRLAAGLLDVVVGYELGVSSAVVVTDVLDDVFVFAAAPNLAGGATPITLAEVLKSDLVFYGEQSVSYRGARSAAAAAGLALQSDRHVFSINVWRSLLTRGMATAISSVAAIDEERDRGEIAIREIVGNPIRSRIGIVVRADDADSEWIVAVRELVRTLVVERFARVALPSWPLP